MTKLFPYQKKDVKRMLKLKGRILLASEMGLGKTLIALTYLRIRPQTLPALVVCPASAKWVWKNEIRKHTKLTCNVLNGKKPQPIHKLRDVTIINYDVLSSWMDILRRNDYQTLILDEVQFCKSHKAKRTKASISLGKKTSRIIAISGTPLTNRPKELYNILHLLLPHLFPSFVSYAFRYCGRRMTPWGWDDTGASHLDELHEILKDTCMIRRTKRQVLKELPEKMRVVLPLPIERPKEYATAEADFLNWLAKKDLGKAKRAEKAEQLVKLGYLKHLAAELKMRVVLEWIDCFLEETDAKLVVFAYHKSIIHKLQTKYENQCVVIDGSTPQKQREENVHRFQHDKKIRLFIGQIIAAGTAITLTAASHAAFVELDWVPGNHIQAEDRLHRIGQKNHVQIYYLIAKGTIEEDLCKIIQKKARIITKILDGETKQGRFDVFDRLIKCLNERTAK
jgi:SWI/SNF-related matrix-associated actin-dependent regulator 1 of chromatin subfamily A